LRALFTNSIAETPRGGEHALNGFSERSLGKDRAEESWMEHRLDTMDECSFFAGDGGWVFRR
jgi:hypothetical protein